MSFVEDTQPFTPERRKAQLRRTQGGYDPKALDQAFEPVTSDNSGVSDALIQSMNQRSQGSEIARSIAPDLGVDVQTPDPSVHKAGAEIAHSVAPDLAIDFNATLGGPASDEGRVPVDDATPMAADKAKTIADSVASTLGVDLAAPRSPDMKVEGQDVTPSPGAEIAKSVAPDLGIDPHHPTFEQSQDLLAQQEQENRLKRFAEEEKARTGREPLGMFAPGGMPEYGSLDATKVAETQPGLSAPAYTPPTAADEAQRVQQTAMTMHGPGGVGLGGIAAAGGLGMLGERGGPVMAPEGKGGAAPALVAPEPTPVSDTLATDIGAAARQNVAASRLSPRTPNASVTAMEDDLHRLITNNQADRLAAENYMKAVPEEVKARDKELYHRGENEAQQNDPAFQRFVQPVREARFKEFNKLKQLTGGTTDELAAFDPEHMHRMRVGATPRMDEAIGAEDINPVKGLQRRLGTKPATTKARSVFAIEDAEGNRKVVTEYPGGDAVRVWENGRPTKVTAGQFGEYGGFVRKVPEHEAGGQEIPYRKTVDRPVVAKAVQGRISLPYIKEGGREIPAHTTDVRQVPERFVQGDFKPGHIFIDKTGKHWEIKQAKTQEIHDAGVRDIVIDKEGRQVWGDPLRYHESAFASEFTALNDLRRAVRNAEFLKKWQESPEFQKYSVPINEGRLGENAKLEADARKAGWVSIDAPGWRGRLYDPRFAEPLNDFFKGIPGYINAPMLETANRIATGSLFWSGVGNLAHIRNVQGMRFVARGWDNLNVARRYRTAQQAWDQVLNNGPDYIATMREGASYPSAGMHLESFEKKLLQDLGHVMEPHFQVMGQRIGMSPLDIARAWEHGTSKAMFKYGDIIMYQRIKELEEKGYSRRKAIEEAEKYMASYRLRSRTGGGTILGREFSGSRAATRFLGGQNTVMFGRFQAAKSRAYGHMINDLVGRWRGPNRATPQERFDALGRHIALITLVAAIGPFMLDKLFQALTGDKNAHANLGGTAGWAQKALKAFEDVKKGRSSTLEAIVKMADETTNLAPALKELLQQIGKTKEGYTGYDFFTSRPIANAPETIGQILERTAHVAGTMVNPVGALHDPARYLLKEPLGISTAKTFTPHKSRRDIIAEKRALAKDPWLIRQLRRSYGGTQ